METAYIPDPTRYDHATFRRCGNSGLVLPAITLGLWQNFGGADVFETGRVSRTSIWPTTTALPTAQPKKTSGRF